MTHAASNAHPRAAQRPVTRTGRSPRLKPSGDDGLAVLSGRAAAGQVTVATTTAWAQSVRRFARVAVWALPGYAVVHGFVTFGWYGDLDTRISRYAGQATDSWFRYTHLVGGPLAAWLGVIALIALTALLVGVRSRRTAVAGLVAGLAGTVVLTPVLGLAGFVQPAFARGFTAADESVASLSGQVYGRPAELTILAGSALCSIGWFLLGCAVFRSRILNRADGVLLMIAAPLVGTGGAFSGPARTMGALLVLAAGIGLAVTAARLVPAGGTAVHRAYPA